MLIDSVGMNKNMVKINKKAFKKLLGKLEDAQTYALDAIELESDDEFNTSIDAYGKIDDILAELNDFMEKEE